ncbi:MAG: DUF3857 domain-containing protein [Pyrinomonadaceae bacterium]
MKIKAGIWLLLALLCASNVFADNDPIVWKPITQAELDMKEPVVDNNADVEALLWEVTFDDSDKKKLYVNTYVRVKIFTERGKEAYSKVDIRYSKDYALESLAARVIKPDGSIQQLTAADFINRQIVSARKVKILARSFAVPGIEPGVIVEYQYRRKIKNDSINGERLDFQRDIPVQNLRYRVRPFKDQTIHPTFLNMADLGFYNDPNERGFLVLDRKSVPAFKEEALMPPEDTLKPWAVLQYSGSNRSILRTISDVSYIYSLIAEPDKEIKRKADQLTANLTNDKAIVRALFDYCRNDIKNLSREGTGTGKEPKIKKVSDVIKKGAGYSIDIDLLFAALLTATNRASYMVFSADRDEYFFDPNSSPQFLDFVHFAGVSVNVEGQQRYFSPSRPWLGFGELDWFEENVYAVLASNGRTKWSVIQMKNPSESLLSRKGKFELSEDGTISGSITEVSNGYLATEDRRLGFEDSDEKRLTDIEEELKAKHSGAVVSDVKLDNFGSPDNPLIKSYKISVPGYGQKTGSRMFFVPNFFEASSKPFFSTNDRLHPVYFSFAWSELDEIEITLPEGYEPESLSTPSDIVEKSKIAGSDYSITYDKQTRKLKYKRDFFLGDGGKIFFPQTVYPALKTLFDKMHNSDTHSIALKRVDK